jgi:hypothetical protein
VDFVSQVALLAVTHDPTGKNIDLFKQLQNDIKGIYGELFITISEESSMELVSTIEQSSFELKLIPKEGAAQARREVLKFGLSGQSQYFHYCDFDRLLTWSKNHLYELKNIVTDIPNHDYLILGRTKRAMNTHPLEWIETEKITNKICSLELSKEVDITAGSCSFSRESASFINNYSKERMTDAEWPMIVHRIAKLKVDYSSVEGLEYDDEINGVTRVMNESEKWLGRLKLSLIISETAHKTGR